MIEDRNLKAGTKLVARYKGQDYACIVMEGDEKGPRFMLDDLDDNRLSSMVFKSPSAAGSEVMGGSACNGWRFWSLEGQEPQPKERKATTPGSEDFRRIPGGRAWCEACCKAFKVEAGTTPTACPEGHTPDDVTTEAEKEAATA